MRLRTLPLFYISDITTNTISPYTTSSTNGLQFALSLKNFIFFPCKCSKLLLHSFIVIGVKNYTILVVKIYLDSYCNNYEQRKERTN